MKGHEASACPLADVPREELLNLLVHACHHHEDVARQAFTLLTKHCPLPSIAVTTMAMRDVREHVFRHIELQHAARMRAVCHAWNDAWRDMLSRRAHFTGRAELWEGRCKLKSPVLSMAIAPNGHTWVGVENHTTSCVKVFDQQGRRQKIIRDVTAHAMLVDGDSVFVGHTEEFDDDDDTPSKLFKFGWANAGRDDEALAQVSIDDVSGRPAWLSALAVIGETVASLSHSIKNILQGLRGGADVVEMGLKKDDLKIAKGGWGILKRNLDRIMSLTLNMLAFSRQQNIEIELTKLGPLIEECAQLLEGICQTRQVPLIVDVDSEIPPVPVDPNLIHQAMMNLMTNAVEAVEPKTGAVTVRVDYHPHGKPGDDGHPVCPWLRLA